MYIRVPNGTSLSLFFYIKPQKLLAEMLCLFMKNIRLPPQILPGFYLPRRGWKSLTDQQKLAKKIDLLKQKSFKQMGELFGNFIPCRLLTQSIPEIWISADLFSKVNTLRAFFRKVVDVDGDFIVFANLPAFFQKIIRDFRKIRIVQ